MSYSFHWNPHFKRKRKAGLQRAQRAIDSSVLRFSEPFLPFQSGALRNSGITGTVVGSGRVQWTAPYGAGTLSFRAYIEDTSDSMTADNGKTRRWGNLSVQFYAQKPQRRPA